MFAVVIDNAVKGFGYGLLAAVVMQTILLLGGRKGIEDYIVSTIGTGIFLGIIGACCGAAVGIERHYQRKAAHKRPPTLPK